MWTEDRSVVCQGWGAAGKADDKGAWESLEMMIIPFFI